MSHAGYGRNFEWTLRGLAERGHEVRLVFDKDKGLGGLVASLEQQYPGLSVAAAPGVPVDDWSTVGKAMRIWLDYLRYLDPAFDEAPKLRARGGRRIPAPLRTFAAGFARRLPRAFGAFRSLCERAHDGFPVSARVREFVEQEAPDLVVITPLLEMASAQPEYLRVCRRLGLPICVPVASWDNLTTKGLIHEPPDLLTVWNEAQAREAETLHGVAPERVAVTGAVAYDHWFGWEPREDRTAFCERLGLDPAEPFVLYMGSSGFIAPDEADVALRWLTGLRAADSGRLAELQVLVRPHPQNPMRGEARDALEALGRIAIHPPKGANPMDTETRSDYFDAIYHCAAVLGVNTSALLEASIVDRPVHTVLEPDYADTQRGTLHFRHLLPENGGMLKVAETVADLAPELARSLSAEPASAALNAEFVGRFIRPHGIEEPASARLVTAIEALAEREQVAVAGVGLWPRVLGLPIAALARLYLKLIPVAIAVRHWVVHRIRAIRHGLRVAFRRGIARRVLRLVGLGDAASRWAHDRALRRSLRALDRSRDPVLAGPFLGEIGFELLYWTPFLNWIATTYPKIGERIVIVSRGGTGSWYGALGETYLDAFELADPSEVTTRRSGLKQRQTAGFELDAELGASARDRLGISRSEELHPTLMWAHYYRYLKSSKRAFVKGVKPPSGRGPAGSRAGLNAVYRPFPKPPVGPLAGVLPSEEFVAVRFYFRNSFPDTEGNRQLVGTLVQRLAEQTHVVLLNNEMELDDHRDVQISDSPRITAIHPYMTAANNLELQSIAISRASAFLGTYGGLAYLGPHYGVPSVGLVANEETIHPWHTELAEAIFDRPPWGAIHVLATGEPELTERVLDLTVSRAPTYTAPATGSAGG